MHIAGKKWSKTVKVASDSSNCWAHGYWWWWYGDGDDDDDDDDDDNDDDKDACIDIVQQVRCSTSIKHETSSVPSVNLYQQYMTLNWNLLHPSITQETGTPNVTAPSERKDLIEFSWLLSAARNALYESPNCMNWTEVKRHLSLPLTSQVHNLPSGCQCVTTM